MTWIRRVRLRWTLRVDWWDWLLAGLVVFMIGLSAYMWTHIGK